MKVKNKSTMDEIFKKYDVPENVVDSIAQNIGIEYDKELDIMDMSGIENLVLGHRQKFGEDLLKKLLEEKDSRIKKNFKAK